jgi:hypothetical protein
MICVWTEQINKFADLTAAEFKLKYTGYVRRARATEPEYILGEVW